LIVKPVAADSESFDVGDDDGGVLFDGSYEFTEL